MAQYFVGSGGSDANAGTSYALRKLTLNGCEDVPVVAGDKIIVAPGVYRELLTVDVSGGTPYATGTVTVTNGSAVVTGTGTSWTGNAFANGQFGVFVVASGADGVTNGTATFTAALGNFQASMIGMTIRINTKGAYLISAVGSATSITLIETDGGTPAPSAGSSLTYDVGPTDTVEILSVDSNTQITLKRIWNQPTFSGVAYQTWRDIQYIADVSGYLTDGVGGVVRMTGSDDDLVATRANCLTATSRNCRTFRGFVFDTPTTIAFTLAAACSNWIIEDCYFAGSDGISVSIQLSGTGVNNTIRRSVFMGSRSHSITFTHTVAIDNSGGLVEACIFWGARGSGVSVVRIGGITVRDNDFFGPAEAVRTATAALTTGQTITVRNNLICYCSEGLRAITAAATNEEITENYNSLWGNTTARTNVSTGSNSDAKPPLFESPLLLAGYKLPWNPLALGQWSTVRAITGLGQSGVDLYGIVRPVTASKRSRGAIQAARSSREITTKRTGTASLKQADAGTTDPIWIPIAAVSTVLSAYVQWEADYAGVKPQMIISQTGQTDIVILATGASGAWEELTHTWTPAASPGYIGVSFRSNNTATSGNYDMFIDDVVRTP